MNPLVVAITLTCGGWKTIGETIHSFNLQTYQNKKLIILDTHVQPLVFTSALPENVEYIRVPSSTFKTLGEKTRYALNLAADRGAEFVAQYEHDDIWLPYHLKQCIEELANPVTLSGSPLRIGHQFHFTSYGGVDGRPIKLSMDQNMCWCRFIYQHVDGHWQKANSDPFDSAYMCLPWQDLRLNQPSAPAYIYRWDNCQHHMSGLYGSKPHDELYKYFEGEFCKVDISKHPVDIAWRHDYVALCKQLLQEKGWL